MKVTVEILHWNGDPQPRLLHVITHESHSLETIRATVQAMIDAPDVPANGYHIVTENGDEFFGSAQRSFWSEHPETDMREG
jgi:hypothetical protein